MKVDDSLSQPFSQSSLPSPQATSPAESAPSLPLLYACFLLAGYATLLLGPILPLLARTWHLNDSQLGLFLLCQFIGATVGGITVGKDLARTLGAGLGTAAFGFVLFAWAVSRPAIFHLATFYPACAALLLAGFGIGRTIASTNVIAGQRYTAHRASALTRLNLAFALGALLSPLLAAWLVDVPLWLRLAPLGIVLLACTLTLLAQRRHAVANAATPPSAGSTDATLRPAIFLYFAALLFIYGGLETSLAAWLTTYALRYGRTSLVLSAYVLVLLLCGLTAGRAFATWLLLRVRESILQRSALFLTAIFAAALATAHSASLIATLAVLLGIALAPVFPITFAQLIPHRPSPRQAGIVLAASGLGAAAIPALMGLVSTGTGSLRAALTLPVAVALLMLLLTLRAPTQSPT